MRTSGGSTNESAGRSTAAAGVTERQQQASAHRRVDDRCERCVVPWPCISLFLGVDSDPVAMTVVHLQEWLCTNQHGLLVLIMTEHLVDSGARTWDPDASEWAINYVQPAQGCHRHDPHRENAHDQDVPHRHLRPA